jgi:hypothetical protein
MREISGRRVFDTASKR